MQIRLQKFLASCGVAARRKCELLISSGSVTVNGETVTLPGTSIDPAKDKICVDGKDVSLEKYVYYALYKPIGVVVTASDSHGVTTYLDIVPDIKERVFSVGRLDLDTEGLLILTNDGELANRLMHPKYHLPKEYLVTVRRQVNEHDMRYLKKGIKLEGKITQPADVVLMKKGRGFARYRVIIREGRKRQIRKMFEAVRHPVMALKRGAVGPVTLGKLHKGEYRPLTRSEVKALRTATGLFKKKVVPKPRPENKPKKRK
jgi:23S rRNA pseudouridine2605 synthase